MPIVAATSAFAPSLIEWRRSTHLIEYPEALSTMQERVAAIRAGAARELVWLVEHPPIYTAGTSAKIDDLIRPAKFPTFDAGRGGQWTYHGPGQRTVYLMLNLARSHGQVRARDTHSYVNGLEDWLIMALAQFGVVGERRSGRVGIWVRTVGGENKIATIGVRISHWVTWHGVALNVAPSIENFEGIIPCGIREHGVTSLRLLGVDVAIDDVDDALRSTFKYVFGDT